MYLEREATATFENEFRYYGSFYRRAEHFPGLKFNVESIPDDTSAIYCELMNLESEVSVTF